jgi:hypothetical protein
MRAVCTRIRPGRQGNAGRQIHAATADFHREAAGPGKKYFEKSVARAFVRGTYKWKLAWIF